MNPLLTWSLRTRLLCLVSAVFLPAAAIVLYTGGELRRQVVEEAGNYALRQTQAMAAHHLRVVENARLLLMTLARASEVRGLEDDCAGLLSDILERNPAYVEIVLADLGGQVVAAAPKTTTRSIADQPSFQKALHSGDFVTGSYTFDEKARRVVIRFAVPVMDQGAPRGVLSAAFDLNHFGSLFSDTRLPEGSVFTLTSIEGMRLTRFPETDKYTWVPDLKRMVERMSGKAEEGSFLEVGVDGVSRLYGFKQLHIPGAPFPFLMLRLGIPVDEALSQANFVMVRNLVLLAMTALVSMALAWILAEFGILRRITHLVDAAERLGSGDLSTRTGLSHGEAELGRLAKAFDDMAQGLEWHEEARRKADEEIKRMNAELEERVQQRTAELASANQELHQAMDGLRRTQNQLVQSEKMAALGGLVAGVAHEINTPVGIGVTAASHLDQKTRELRQLFEKGEMKRSDFSDYMTLAMESSGMILGNLERASELIKSFKKVAVDQTTEERRAFKIGPYIKEILLSLRPRLKKTALQVEVRCDPDLEVNSYPGAFSQIISNFVVNSLEHAYEPGQSGRMTIDVAVENGRLSITYADDGRGMPPEVLAHIFEPFFTTSRHKGGTGLGLSIVYNIVTQKLQGEIICRSEAGKGSTFIITTALNQEGPHAAS